MDDWWSKAICQEYDPNMWVLPSKEDSQSSIIANNEAIGICWDKCPVRLECEKFALDNPSLTCGMIYGGKRFNHSIKKPMENQRECKICGKWYNRDSKSTRYCGTACRRIADKVRRKAADARSHR